MNKIIEQQRNGMQYDQSAVQTEWLWCLELLTFSQLLVQLVTTIDD